MPLTTYGDISPRTAARAAKKLLERGQYLMTLERFGTFDPQPRKKSLVRKWRRYESLSRATSPLAEGITPQGQQLTYTDYQATLEQYGDYVTITDVIKDTHEDPVLNESMDLCGEQAAETIEFLRYMIVRAGTNVFYANGVASRSLVNSPAVPGDFKKIERAFRRAKARTISKIIKASAMITTESVQPAFFAIVHTDCKADLNSMTGWTMAKDYSDSMKALPGEIGAFETTRVIASAIYDPWLLAGVSGTTFLANGVIPSGAGKADVYPIVVIAKNSYGIVPLQGEGAVHPSVLNPGIPREGDQLGQRGYVSWKTYQTAAILNQLWLARLEVAATAEPV